MSDPNTPEVTPEPVRPSPPPHPFSAEGAAPQPGPRRSKRRAWLIAGTIALAFTIAVVAFSTIRMQATTQIAGDAAPLESASPEDLGIDVPPIVWPKNMASGGVVYRDAMQPDTAAAPSDDAAPTPSEVQRGTGPADILLFVDYRCPACVLFESTNGKLLTEAVSTGEATLEVQALTFLDRIDPEDAYSTRAAAAQACVVDGQPELAWTTHQLLLDPNFAPAEGAETPSNEAFVHAFDKVGDGLSPDVQSCIESRTFEPFASAMNEWVFQNSVPNAESPELAVQGTPTVLVNGVLFEGGPGDAEGFKAFLNAQGLLLD